MKNFFKGLSAGLMIAIGCAVYLACTNKYVGACLFSVALITTCIKEYSLFTGKIGYIITSHKKQDVSLLLFGLLGNVVAVIVFGLLISVALPDVSAVAKTVCENKLSSQNLLQTLIRAGFCGVLMYVAVSIYKEQKSIVGILFAIPTFILAGFEHSIADIGYFAISGIISFEVILFILVVIVGNTLGSFILPLLKGKEKQSQTDEKQD